MDDRPDAVAVPQELKELFFRLAFEETEEAVVGLDAGRAVATWSRGAADLLGVAPGDALHRPFEDLMPPALRDRGRELLDSLEAGGQARNVEGSLVHRNGAEVRVRLSVRRIGAAGPALAREGGSGFVVWIRPQTAGGPEWRLEDPNLRELVSRMQQLGAVGQLSAALAHQIRTPLHVIQSTVEFIQDELPGGHPHQEGLRVVNRNVERIAEVTEALRGFMQPRKHATVPGDLNKVVEQACLFIEMLCKKCGIKLKKSLGAIPAVRLDPDHLLGALYNLMANAVEAMPDGGVLTVTTGSRGQEVVLTVADTGRGMPPAVLEQVGRPFFTTKTLGTGLGVFVARQILEQHRAAMQIESKHEVGTRVAVAFPAA